VARSFPRRRLRHLLAHPPAGEAVPRRVAVQDVEAPVVAVAGEVMEAEEQLRRQRRKLSLLWISSWPG
jgi:hypothetical protein